MMAFWEQMPDRDRRGVAIIAATLLLGALINYWPDATTTTGDTAEATESQLELAQKRRLRLQQMVATVPSKQDLLKKVQADIDQREKGLIVADTAAQAQAQLIQVLRQVGRQQNPPIELRGMEGGMVMPLGDAYGQVATTVGLECPVEALVNYLTDITRQPQLLATQEIRVGATNSKQKIISVRLTVAGVVPKRLVPEKKGRL
jgi:hypothetical protein